MMGIEFMGQLWRITRDHEDEGKITFLTDAQQLEKINEIPSQAMLKITIEVEEIGNA